MEIVNTANAPAAIGPYVQAVKANGMLYTSGQIPVNPKTGEIPNTVEAQTQQVLDNLKAILDEAGVTVNDIIKTTVFIKNMNDFTLINGVYEQFFISNKAKFPARSCVEVARLPKDVLIEIEAIAVLI